MDLKTLEKSIVWEKSYKMALEIYQITKFFPREEKYCLANQLRRSAMSIPLNISEGRFRNSKVDFARFLTMARGSCGEMLTQLKLAKDLDYVKQDAFDKLILETVEIIKILTASIITLRSYGLT